MKKAAARSNEGPGMQLRVKYYIPEEYSGDAAAEMKSRLKTLSRSQLELLVCVLTREIIRLEHQWKSYSYSSSMQSPDKYSSWTQKKGSSDVQKMAKTAAKGRVRETNCAADRQTVSIVNGKQKGTRHSKCKKTEKVGSSSFKWSGHQSQESITDNGELQGTEGSSSSNENIVSVENSTRYESDGNTEGGLKYNHQAQKSTHGNTGDLHDTLQASVMMKEIGVKTTGNDDGLTDGNDKGLTERQILEELEDSSLEKSLKEQGLMVIQDCSQGKLDVFVMHSGQMVYHKPDMDASNVPYSKDEDNHFIGAGSQPWNVSNQRAELEDAKKDLADNKVFSQLTLNQNTVNHPHDHSRSAHTGTKQLAEDIFNSNNGNIDVHGDLHNIVRQENFKLTSAYPSSKTALKESQGILKDKEKDEGFLCPVCEMGFPSEQHLRHHKRLAHKCGKYSCMMCSKTFRYKNGLKIHLKNSHSRKTVLCSYCGKLVLHTRIKMHMEKVHERPLYTCHICHKGFLKRECLEGHVNKHSNTKPYICEYCGRKYAYSTSLCSHKKLCSKSAVPSHLLHPRSQEEKDTSYICEICGMKFEGTSGLKDHYNAKHSSKLLNCAFCGKEFHWRPSYNRHVKKCKDRTEQERAKCKQLQYPIATGKIYTCLCGKQYPYRQSYQRHQKSCQKTRDVEAYVVTSAGSDIPFSEYLGSSLELSSTLNLHQ